LGEDDDVGEEEAAELDDERPQRTGLRLAKKLDLALVKRERLDGVAEALLLPEPPLERSSSGTGNEPGLAGISKGLLQGRLLDEEVPTELLGDMSPTVFTA
jgi:hypothetical protein